MANFYIVDSGGRLRGHHSGYPTRESAVRGLAADVDTDPHYPEDFPFEVRNASHEVVHTMQLPARS